MRHRQFLPLGIFQSTPSTQRETMREIQSGGLEMISIHSLYAEGDKITAIKNKCFYYFNPLPLRRGRLFQGFWDGLGDWISIHSLYAEGDGIRTGSLFWKLNFNPLPLRRGRPICKLNKLLNHSISIHSLYAEGDGGMLRPQELCRISIHSLYAEGDNLLTSIITGQ